MTYKYNLSDNANIHSSIFGSVAHICANYLKIIHPKEA
jgi:hypothetical protein